MITNQEKTKIEDFKNALKEALNQAKDPAKNKIIDALFYNVEKNYEEYKDAVPYVSAEKEQYKYHFLQPVDGKYPLLDFLINRAVSSTDQISTEKNNRTKGKARVGISKDGIYLQDKLKTFEEMLGNKYSNMLHTEDIPKEGIKPYSLLAKGGFSNHYVDEAATEYYDAKFSGVLDQTENYESFVVTKLPKQMVAYGANSSNKSALGTRFMYHLNNLVPDDKMFESRFFGNDVALEYFSTKYKDIINKVWDYSIKRSGDYSVRYRDADSRFKYLMSFGCNYDAAKVNDDMQKKLYNAQNILDQIFVSANFKEYKDGNIPGDTLSKIALKSSQMAPSTYNESTKQFEDSPSKEWYKSTYQTIEKHRQKGRQTLDER